MTTAEDIIKFRDKAKNSLVLCRYYKQILDQHYNSCLPRR